MGKLGKNGNKKSKYLRDLDDYIVHLEPKKHENEHMFGLWHGLLVARFLATNHDMATFKHPEFPEKWGWQIRQELSEGVPKKELVHLSPNAPMDKLADKARRGN